MRTVRDSVHGDIELDAIAAEIIDTREFQRLRYIRQNGLLHFVFPGAMHTRFAHSIGTYHNACKLIEQLLRAPRKHASADELMHLTYVTTVFTCAALLHDVGHVAFSHSAERVQVGGRKKKWLLGTINDLFSTWKIDKQFRSEYERALANEDPPRSAESQAIHEDLSIFFVQRIFENDAVIAACNSESVTASDCARDVCALINGDLDTSDAFDIASASIAHCVKRVDVEYSWLSDPTPSTGEEPLDLRYVLHGLISGTLDVDRMDYLLRDSQHCGVQYGRIDKDF